MQSIQERITQIKSQIEGERQFDENGQEFWSARGLAPILGYRNWEQIPGLIERASAAAENAGASAQNHFRPASKMVAIGSKSARDLLDFRMSRYGCYLFAMNGDPRKPEISCAQSYFVVKTHQMETVERQALEDQQARALPAAAPTLPAPVGMDFLQQFAGNVLVAIQQQAHTTKEEVKAEIRTEITQTLGEWPISGSQPREIHSRVGKLAKLMGGQRAHFSDAWRRLKDRYEVIGYRDLTVGQFDDAVKFLDLQIASYQTDGGLFRGEL
ncbi:BRO family protein [Deinococcus marmoris]|uniref:DNA-damage-inducible protein D n=1 Tax=Deinococcus marmoris TaxID=249408 RepID=A0A1U7P4T0_9DEIO|nr:BRO family protein [Deinococcus marmoris]OLV20185.1 DNA-damage-inducible protein D [Deinococcus marmoris]